jgi:hypothetical protein
MARSWALALSGLDLQVIPQRADEGIANRRGIKGGIDQALHPQPEQAAACHQRFSVGIDFGADMAALLAALDKGADQNTLQFMRLGKGEAFYKGNSLYIDLVNSLSSKYPGKFEFHFMGRGSPEEAKPFTEIGIVAHLNATDSQRDLFLRDLDIFISFSLWEGFNLPLLEAQIMGTATIALDTGAHPEVTPLIADNMFDLENFVLGMSESLETLLRHSQNAFHWSRQRFKWQTSLKKLEALVQQKSGVVGYSDIPQISIFAKSKLFVSRVNWALNTYGVRLLAVKIMRRLMRRLIKA